MPVASRRCRARHLWLIAAFAAACGSLSSPTPPGATASLVGAGDIGDCSAPGPFRTALLLDGIAGTVFTTGDHAYPVGTAANFINCYAPTWGRHQHRTRPVPGNHDYETPGASAYFEYFGGRAGPPGLGYYSYDEGTWHVIALNSEVPLHPGSPQIDWLRADLASAPRRCTLAYWHRPLFSSGRHGGHSDVRDLWRILYEANADVILAGHEHLYERFAPQDPDGRLDAVRGLRQFTVGTGGASLYEFQTTRPNSEARVAAWGVLSLTLSDSTYMWQFLSAVDGTALDSGVAACH